MDQFKTFRQGHPQHLPPRRAIAQRNGGAGPTNCTDTQGAKHRDAIGTDLNARADFGDFIRLLEHTDFCTALRQHRSHSEPTDARA